MTLIRRRYTGTHQLQLERQLDPARGWTPTTHLVGLGYEAPFTPAWELRHAISYGGRPGMPVLPFQPLSVRHYYGTNLGVLEGAYDHLRRLVPPVAAVAYGVMQTARQRLSGLNELRAEDLPPAYRLQNALTVLPTRAPLSLPGGAKSLDFEPRIGFIINRPLSDATPEEAEKAIGALVAVTEFGPSPVGNVAAAVPATPISSLADTVVSADTLLSHWADLEGTVTINGEVIDKSPVGRAADIGPLLAATSAGEQLLPGELFTLDALDGAGSVANGTADPLKPGDQLVVDLPGLGRIEHTVV